MTRQTEQVLIQVREGVTDALEAMGETAAGLVRAQMRTGYGRPIHASGALEADVRWAREEGRVRVGNTLDYAGPIHNGTGRMIARPYLTDALSGSGERLASAAAQAIRSHVE